MRILPSKSEILPGVIVGMLTIFLVNKIPGLKDKLM